jgi:hypothetical protein
LVTIGFIQRGEEGSKINTFCLNGPYSINLFYTAEKSHNIS